ncbi:mCG141886, partial [Mus musculus]
KAHSPGPLRTSRICLTSCAIPRCDPSCLPTQVAQKGTRKEPYTTTECPPSTIHYQETPFCAGRLALGRTGEVRAPLFTISGLLEPPEVLTEKPTHPLALQRVAPLRKDCWGRKGLTL